jgi:hypothetical protein
VQTRSALLNLKQELIIKSIVQTNAAECLQTEGLWKSIMKKRQSGLVRQEFAKNVRQN